MAGFDDISGTFRFDTTDSDSPIRSAAFAELQRLTQISENITTQQIAAGFKFGGERIPFVNPQRGIFKPRQMRHLLSIRTVIKAPGRRVWYDDQREVHQQIFSGDDVIDYAFMGRDPEAADNRWLRDAMDFQIPIIYFLGTAPGFYQAIFPTFVVGFDASALKAKIAFSATEAATVAPETTAERRYALRIVKQRLHQASFREMVITAYQGRCAISGLPEPLLLDAAHIIDDGNELLGQPTIKNGIPLSKIHHAAFDAHLIGVDPNYKIHVSEKLLNLRDGPTLEALRRFNGEMLREPTRKSDLPDRDRLALRFEKFKAAA
ncbi:MAG: HNH endonuclease [Rhizomicrobium sp.]